MSRAARKLWRSRVALLCASIAAAWLPVAYAVPRPLSSPAWSSATPADVAAAEHECADAWAEATRISAYIRFHRAHRDEAGRRFAAQSAATAIAAAPAVQARRAAIAARPGAHRSR